MIRKRLVLLLCLAALAVLAPRAHAGTHCLVSAGPSLSAAFKEIGSAFAAANPGVEVSFQLRASGALLQQIERARRDVFASADQETMDRAQERGLIAPAAAGFHRQPAGAGRAGGVALGLKTSADLASRRSGASPSQSGPGARRRYARDALAPALAQTLAPRFVHAESVRQAAAVRQPGRVDAAFVYASDAAARGQGARRRNPADAQAIAYPARCAASGRQALARASWTSSPDRRPVRTRTSRFEAEWTSGSTSARRCATAAGASNWRRASAATRTSW